MKFFRLNRLNVKVSYLQLFSDNKLLLNTVYEKSWHILYVVTLEQYKMGQDLLDILGVGMPQKLPHIYYTVIVYVSTGKVAWFAVYICANIWNT